MKYCKFCGKKLEEGEVCSCQIKEDESSFFKDIDKNKISNGIKKVLSKPASGAKQITASFSLKESAATWLGEGMITGICLMIFVSSTIGSSYFGRQMISYPKIFIYSLLFVIGINAVTTLVLWSLEKLICKSSASYAGFMTVPAAAAPINVIFLVLCTICLLLNPGLGILVFISGRVASSFLMGKAVDEVNGTDREKTMYILAIAFIVVSLVLYIVLKTSLANMVNSYGRNMFMGL
ncbi:hypothetical protein [Anaerostipes sp.]|uniref:hypothetical protein n=1 Tax=Anaerostipes sp. TaxID=1872530 RepID=UPI0025BC9993|nr:hypothetical protein [Anaerostipes sp.]MBS7009219.1 hypothetical protein [Anaerostipes sp.]